ncbi:hypothetical protein CEXT_637561, partial [Caerostris extrusa]
MIVPHFPNPSDREWKERCRKDQRLHSIQSLIHRANKYTQKKNATPLKYIHGLQRRKIEILRPRWNCTQRLKDLKGDGTERASNNTTQKKKKKVAPDVDVTDCRRKEWRFSRLTEGGIAERRKTCLELE